MARSTTCLLALFLAASLSAPAAALPRTMDALEAQEDICRTGVKMILNGASDDEELDFYERSLRVNGWTEDGDLEDLLLLCNFYKAGYLYHRDGED